MKNLRNLGCVCVLATLTTMCTPGGTPDTGVVRDTGTNQETGTTSDGGTPAPPALGAQLERMGRPAINTALNHAFDADSTRKGTAKDGYNTALPATWSTFVTEFRSNLAVYDSLDMSCGNQLAASPTDPRYGPLAGVLADDQLYVNSANTTCAMYLAVESNALGTTNTDCGGRTPTMDVIDATYSALAAGVTSGIGDGVTVSASVTQAFAAFPYLPPPQ